MPNPNRNRDPNAERRRALALLAGSPDGCTEGLLMVHGLTTEVLAHLVRAGLATAAAERMGCGQPIDVVRLKISEAGRITLK